MSRTSGWVACVALLAAVSIATVAHAVPTAANSFVPSHMLLMGRSGDLADTTSGAFTIVVRDAANAPVAGSVVEVRILNCPGVRLSAQTYDAGSSIRCGTAGVLKTTNLFGEVRMTLVGGGIAGGPAGAGACVQVFASGVPIGGASLAYLDLDGSGGMGGHDISLWLADVGSGEDIIGRGDYDGSGTLGANDLSIWLMLWGAGGSAESAAAYCP
jgi:hypothetical protein